MPCMQKGRRKGTDEGFVKRDRTNFDLYLEEHLNDPVFAERFKKAWEAWDVVLQAASICKP